MRLPFAGHLLPHGDVDDDEEQQGERRDPTANDESYRWEQCLVHHLLERRQEQTSLLDQIIHTYTHVEGRSSTEVLTHAHISEASGCVLLSEKTDSSL